MGMGVITRSSVSICHDDLDEVLTAQYRAGNTFDVYYRGFEIGHIRYQPSQIDPASGIEVPAEWLEPVSQQRAPTLPLALGLLVLWAVDFGKHINEIRDYADYQRGKGKQTLYGARPESHAWTAEYKHHGQYLIYKNGTIKSILSYEPAFYAHENGVARFNPSRWVDDNLFAYETVSQAIDATAHRRAITSRHTS